MRQRASVALKLQSPCRVNASDVLDCAKTFGGATWTTSDVAQKMRVPEYSIRTAIFWLQKRKLIEDLPELERRYTCTKRRPYRVKAYRVLERGGPPDLAALEMALGFCRAFIRP